MDKRKIKIVGKWRAKKQVPDLRLCGKWLRDIGFEIGDEVEITKEGDKLTIERIGK